MKREGYCKNCGVNRSLPSSDFCKTCKSNHDFAVFLKNLMVFLNNKISFNENDFKKMGIDELDINEYIWNLSNLNLINFYNNKFFINLDQVKEFINKHYIDQLGDDEKISVIDIDGKYYEVYDPLKVKPFRKSISYKPAILKLANNSKFINESPNIPFPQADDLNRFIFICQHLCEKDLSKQEIKKLNQVHDRIVNMYTGVGLYFNIFEKYKLDNNIVYRLNKKGKFIFKLGEYDRNIAICHCILQHKIFNEIFWDCLSKNEIKTENIVNIMLNYDLNLNSSVTIKRRASCVSSWMHWIFDLMNFDETEQ